MTVLSKSFLIVRSKNKILKNKLKQAYIELKLVLNAYDSAYTSYTNTRVTLDKYCNVATISMVALLITWYGIFMSWYK